MTSKTTPKAKTAARSKASLKSKAAPKGKVARKRKTAPKGETLRQAKPSRQAKTSAPRVDPLRVLEEDHENMRALFKRFADVGEETQTWIIRDAVGAILVHAAIEEQLFYPAARNLVHNLKLIDASVERLGAVQKAIDELAENHDAGARATKFRQVAKLVEDHVSKEVQNIFPQCAQLSVKFPELGSLLKESRATLSRVRLFL